MSNNTAPVKTAMVIANCTAVDGVSAVSVCCGLVIISIDVVIVAFGGILAAAICGCMHSAVMHCDNASDFHMDMSYIHSDSMYAGGILVSTRIKRYLPELKAVISVAPCQARARTSSQLGMTLDWRRGFEPVFKLPEFLKPSPLALIYKPLLESDSTKLQSFSFPDFDAY